jgi:ABC-type cobalamin/Fe3+-siderophores transport system ATPase subunit
MNNWYDKIPKDKLAIKRDKNFQKHFIEPNSMICAIGGTGSGKTNSLVDFLARKQNAFCDIIIYSGSTIDEPLYEYIKKQIPETQFYNDIEDVPELNTFDDSKAQEKLIVFDDFINLKPKEMTKINQYFTAGRKFGFTCFVMAQNYVSIPKIVLRNVNYFIIFKLNEAYTINHILKNYNIYGLDKDLFLNAYHKATASKFHFLLIDLKNKEYHLRHNWTKMLL